MCTKLALFWSHQRLNHCLNCWTSFRPAKVRVLQLIKMLYLSGVPCLKWGLHHPMYVYLSTILPRVSPSHSGGGGQGTGERLTCWQADMLNCTAIIPSSCLFALTLDSSRRFVLHVSQNHPLFIHCPCVVIFSLFFCFSFHAWHRLTALFSCSQCCGLKCSILLWMFWVHLLLKPITFIPFLQLRPSLRCIQDPDRRRQSGEISK